MTVGLPVVAVQGQAVVTADNLNTFVQGCLNVGAARSVTGVTGQLIYLQGYSTLGDGGQGVFVYSASSVATDDGGVTTITPTGSGLGAWLRVGAAATYLYEVVTTGFSVLFPAGVTQLILDPAGTLATGSITLPASPGDGQSVKVSSTHAVTAISFSAGLNTVFGAPTSLSANVGVTFTYVLSKTTWFKT